MFHHPHYSIKPRALQFIFRAFAPYVYRNVRLLSNIDKQLSIWFVRQDRQGKILGLKEKKLNAQSGSSGEADEIYQQLLNMKTPPAGADKY